MQTIPMHGSAGTGILDSMINEERLVQLFRELCLIDAPALQEKNAAAYVKTYLQNLGLEVIEDDAGAKIGGNANNIIAWLRGNKPDAPRIFLSAHLDTVEPTAGLMIEERDGTFYSVSDTILGADDKGGMAPAIEAVHALIETGEPHGDVCLLFSVAEEIGLKGADALDIQSLNLDYGYVLDTGPPVGSFVTRTATHDKMDITITGKPAHAGKDPEKGINAIQVAATAIEGMKLGRIGPETTANIGIIQGGTAVNVVCQKVLLKAEARSTSIEELDEQVGHMIQRFEAAASQWGAEVEIDHQRHYYSYSIPEDSAVVQVAMEASKRLGFEPKLRTTLGGSDANVYNAKGIPCIVVATGMDKIHTHDECISRVDLVNTARLAYELIVLAAR
jgi:tripeptide aminopeptidase